MAEEMVAHLIDGTPQITVLSFYTTPPYTTDWDIKLSCGGSQFFLPWNFTKEL